MDIFVSFILFVTILMMAVVFLVCAGLYDPRSGSYVSSIMCLFSLFPLVYVTIELSSRYVQKNRLL